MIPIPPKPWFLAAFENGLYEKYPAFLALTAAMVQAVGILGLHPDRHMGLDYSPRIGTDPLHRGRFDSMCQAVLDQPAPPGSITRSENILSAFTNFLAASRESLMQNELGVEHIRNINVEKRLSRMAIDVLMSKCVAIVGNLDEAKKQTDDFPPMEDALFSECGNRLSWLIYAKLRDWEPIHSTFSAGPGFLIPLSAGPRAPTLSFGSDEPEAFDSESAETEFLITKALLCKVRLLETLEQFRGSQKELSLSSLDPMKHRELVEHALLACKAIDFSPALDKPETYLQWADFETTKLGIRSALIGDFFGAQPLPRDVAQGNAQRSSGKHVSYNRLAIREAGLIISDMANFVVGLDWRGLRVNAAPIVSLFPSLSST